MNVNEYLKNPGDARCNNFYDWFCKDSSLANKQISLDKKVRKISKSPKIDCENMGVMYKNNCPLYGTLYDDIRFYNVDDGDIVYTIVPRSGHESIKGQSEIWGAENGFDGPILSGSWKDVLDYFLH